MDETILAMALLEDAHDWDAVEKALEALRQIHELAWCQDGVAEAIDTILVNLPGRDTNER